MIPDLLAQDRYNG